MTGPSSQPETIDGVDMSADAARDTGGNQIGDAESVDAPAIDLAGETVPSCSACADYGSPTMIGRVDDETLNSTSGIAASRRNPGILYIHNDRERQGSLFFAVTEAGMRLGQYVVRDLTITSLKDIAVGPCPIGSCVFIADIGDNSLTRASYTILRIGEPPLNPTGAALLGADQLVFTYPDGSHDAESLLVDPRTSTLYVITKVRAGAPSVVYRLPSRFGAASAVATKIADLPVPRSDDQPATGASAHPCGIGFLLRTNNALYEFRIAAGTSFEESFRAIPARVPVAVEDQGEGVTYRPDGRGYFTTSEGVLPPINRVLCR